MVTQRANRLRRIRRWVIGPAVGPASPLALVTAAAAQSAGGSSAGDGAPSARLLVAGAAILLLVGYALRGWRRRRARPARAEAAPEDDTAPLARDNDLTQADRPNIETGNAPGGRPDATAASSWPSTLAAACAFEWHAHHARGAAQAGRERAVGYTTFPDRQRAVSPESRYQARRISAACEARGMALHQLVGDVQSYSGPDLERPGLTHALELLADGDASCLVVAGLDRLSRSAANLGTMIEWLDDVGARLVVIDIDLDTHTEKGRQAARALARVGALERRSETAPPPRRARRERSGLTRGRPAVSDLPLLQRRIATMRASGMTLQSIADTLNQEGVPTLRGGAKWRPSSVQAATGYKRPGRHAAEPAGAERDDEG